MRHWQRAPGSSLSKSEPLYLGCAAISRALGLHPTTVKAYIIKGLLTGIHVRASHYADDRPRTTNKGRWLVSLSSVRRLIGKAYGGRTGEYLMRALARRSARLARTATILARSPDSAESVDKGSV